MLALDIRQAKIPSFLEYTAAVVASHFAFQQLASHSQRRFLPAHRLFVPLCIQFANIFFPFAVFAFLFSIRPEWQDNKKKTTKKTQHFSAQFLKAKRAVIECTVSQAPGEKKDLTVNDKQVHSLGFLFGAVVLLTRPPPELTSPDRDSCQQHVGPSARGKWRSLVRFVFLMCRQPADAGTAQQTDRKLHVG